MARPVHLPRFRGLGGWGLGFRVEGVGGLGGWGFRGLGFRYVGAISTIYIFVFCILRTYKHLLGGFQSIRAVCRAVLAYEIVKLGDVILWQMGIGLVYEALSGLCKP